MRLYALLARDAGPAALDRAERVDSSTEELADAAEELYRSGIRLVHLEQPVTDAATASFWHLNRELSSWGVRLDYALEPSADVPATLWHLQPPRTTRDGARAWRERHHYLMLSARHAGSFVQVTDRRTDPQRYTVHDPALLAAARTYDAPRPLADRAAVQVLLDAALLHLFGDLALWLPIRFRRPPTPAFVL